jgi:hypothetical protein
MKAWAKKATPVRAALLVIALQCLVGCSSGHGKAGHDAGKDASTGGGTGGGGGSDGGFIRRRDAQTTSGDPIPMCDRFAPMSCGPGQQCRLVIRRAADAGTQFSIYAGCVEGVAARRLGDPCDQFGGQAQPYRADGLQDEVYVDPCGEGQYCAQDPKVRNHFSCQLSCESGNLPGQAGMACPSATQFCTAGTTNPTGLEEVCRESDACDPTNQVGCAKGLTCYLRLNDTGNGVLSVCAPMSMTPVADGEVCKYINACNPGSSCFGPTRLPPSRWMSSDLVCRRSCNVSGAGAGLDGGSDEDGGATGGRAGRCSAATSCVDFAGSGLKLDALTRPLGQCE